MSYQELNRKLIQLRSEDYIWLIYIGIIFISWYSNRLEKNYIIYNDLRSREEYRKTIILIFSVLVVIYIYFFNSAIDDVKSLKKCDSYKKKNLTRLSLIGSLLILISGIIFLHIAIMDEEIDIELAFN